MKKSSLLLSFLLISSAVFSQTRIDGNFPFQTNPAKKYSIYIPSTYNANTPNSLMLGMHPFNTARWDGEAWCDTLINFAEANNLLLLCPDGGANGNISDAIDIAFTTVLLDSMRQWYNVDLKKTYIMGFSVGGRVTYTYGLDNPNVFGGLIPIGAAINGLNEVNAPRQANSNCRAVYIVHGGNDTPAIRYSPVRNALINAGSILNSILMPGVGHTIDFPNRNSILTSAFQFIDSVNTASLQADAGIDVSTCPGVGVTIGGSVSGSGGQCPYSYSWTPSIGLSSSTIANPVASPSVMTTYTLVVVDNRGDSTSDQVTVSMNPTPSASFNWNMNIPSVVVFGNTSTGANSWLWDFGDGSTDTVNSPAHVYFPGNYQVCLTATNALGCTNIFCDSVSIGINSIKERIELSAKAYPNPTSGKVIIEFESRIEKISTIHLLDLTGRSITIKPKYLGNKKLELDLSTYSSGIYNLNIQPENKWLKLIKN